MGLTTIDPHSQKEHIKNHKIPSLVLIVLVLTEIQRFKKRQNYTRFQCYVHRRNLRSSFDVPSLHMLFKRLFNCETGNFHIITGRNDK